MQRIDPRALTRCKRFTFCKNKEINVNEQAKAIKMFCLTSYLFHNVGNNVKKSALHVVKHKDAIILTKYLNVSI